MVLPAENLNQSVTDEALMLAYAKGTASAFDSLYQRHKKVVFRFFVKQGLSQAIAEELCHDTWLKLINAREKYQQQALFRTYLFTIARNTLIDELRQLKKWQWQELTDEHLKTDSFAKQHELVDRLTLFNLAISQLSFYQREALIFQQEGFSVMEISQLIGEPFETVKTRLRYAKNNLKAMLGNHHERG